MGDLSSILCSESCFSFFILVILCCKFDDVKVITGGADALIIIWDIKMGHLMQTLRDHTAEVVSNYLDF